MAANLPMMISLQLDTASAAKVAKNIESSLSRIKVKTLDAKNFAKTNAALNDTSKQLEKTGKKAEKFWDTLEGRARSGIAFTIVNTALLKVTGAVSQAVRESIKYETELLKISQVTGDTVAITKSYQKTLFDVSKEYNVNITKVAQLTRTLTQTGLTFREAAKGAEILSRTSLLATFDSLTSTTEGLIAVMQTFNLTVNQSGKVLEQINDVSKAFAVESSDIVEAIRRTGGAFSSAGGQVDELIALFTSVRSTSRESAETIATGFRTIFGRLQRPKTIEYFKQLGIQLQTAEGQFIGPLKAIEEIGKGLDRLGIQAGSVKFAQVVEQIGGIRQISRVVPLLEQYRKTQQALDIQNQSSVGTYDDIKKAQQGLGFQVGQLKQEFVELISSFVNSDSFKIIAKTFIGFTRTIISLTKALKPVLPLLTALFTFKIGRGMSKLLSGGFSLKGARESLGFATGGMVPGSGNSDTVPAMLTPGEFVIRKSAVKAFGADRLASINKYASGGIVELTKRKPSISGYYDADPASIEDRYEVNPRNWSLVKRRMAFRDDAKNIWNQAVKQKDPNAYIYKNTGGFAGEGSQKLGPKELDVGSTDERRLNKIAGALAELEVEKYLKTAKKLTDKEGPDFKKDGEFFEVKTTKRKIPEKEIVAKAVLAEGIDKNGSYKNGSIQTVEPKITYIRAMNKGGFVQKFEDGGVAEDIQLSQEALQDLQRYTLSLSFGLNSQLADPSNERYATRNYEREIKNLDSLMVFDLPSMLYSGYSHKKYEIIKKKIDSLSPDPRNPDFNLLKGEVLSFPGFLSASTDYDLAKSFGSDMSGGVMNIKTKGKGVDVVQALTSAGLTTSLSEMEKEFILPRNSKFKVENIERNPKGLLSYFLDVQQFAEGGEAKKQYGKISLLTGNRIQASYMTKEGQNNQVRGHVVADKMGDIYSVQSSSATKGYGPRLYDAVMEAATEAGSMLTSDRRSVSDSAKKVWDFYFSRRPDVKKTPLDPINWTSNGRLIDEKLYGKPDTWPPKTDPAWVLQTGYSKNPSIINNPDFVKRFATGGSVGTDTVPALLTPGEFVINKKSAQAFGYDKLHKINKYAEGGVVDEDEDKSKTGKAPRTLTKTERKQRIEQYKSDKLGTSLTRGERTGGWQKEILAKYSKLIAEEKAAIQEVYLEKMRNAIAEKKSIGGIVNKKNAAQKEAERAGSLAMNKAISNKASEIQAKKDSDKLKKASEALVVVEMDTRSALEKFASSIVENTSRLNISFAEVIWNTEAIANSLEAYGFAINRDALEAGKTKGAQFSLAADMVRKIDEKSINNLADSAKGAGSALRQFGKTIGGKWGSAIEKAGGGILAFGAKVSESAATLAKFAKVAGRILDVMAYLELIGGFFDSLFSKDYKQIKELAIERGDVGAAGEAAAAQYNQEFLRGIPIIGGFLSAMQELIPEYFLQLGATGRLVVATAELQASINGLDRKIKKAQEAYLDAAREGDNLGIQQALNQQDAAIQDILNRANSQTGKIEQAKAESGTDIATRTAMGVAGGALAGAAIGGTIGGIAGLIGGPFAAVTAAAGATIGAGVGAIVGGVTAFVSAWNGSQEAILEAYQAQGDAIEKWGEEYSEQTRRVGDAMTESALQVLKAGGSLDDAFVRLKEVFGEDRVNKMFKGGTDGPGIRKSYDDANKRYQEAQKRAEEARKTLDEKRIEEAAAMSDWLGGSRSQAQQNRAAAEVELDRAEAAEKVAAAEKEAVLNFQIRTNQQIALNKQIAIENRAMRERITLSRELVAVFDKINYSLYDMQIASENVSNAASGRISGSQILSERNIGIDERTLRMSGDEVLRNEDAFNQMFEAVSRLGSVRLSGSLREAKQNYDAFGKMEELLLSNNALGSKISEIVAEAKQQASESLTSEGGGVQAGTLIADSIKDALAASGIQLNAQLDEAIQEYGNLLAAGTESSAAIEKIREKLGQEAVDLIEKTSAKYNEYIQMEQEYNSYKLDLIRKNAELTQKAYNAEREYFEQRIALTNKVEDILNPEPVGPGRAAFLEQRASQRRDRNFEGLKSARSRGNLPDDTARSEIGFQAGVRSLQKMNLASSEAAEKLAKLSESGNMLLNTLQDEIKYEQDYLDALIEAAKAQQEYTQALNDAQGELVRSLVTGTDEEQADLLSTLNAAAYSAMQGSFQGIPADMKKDIFSIFDQFGDVEIPGLGMTGRDAQREITRNELMMNWGLDAATADQLASKAVKDRVPIDERMKDMIELQEQKILQLLERERQMKQYLQMIDMYQNQIFAQAVDKFRQAIDDFVNNQLNAQQGNPVGNMAADASFELEALKTRQADEMAAKDAEIKAAQEAQKAAEEKATAAEEKERKAKQTLEDRTSELRQLEESAQMGGALGRRARATLPRRREDVRLAEERAIAAGNDRIREQQAATDANERLIALEEDRDALLSRQADEREMLIETRQAEINATSVSINGNPITPTTQSRGGVIYAANGQLVNYEPRGTDTVPAMLTPGEFVMRKSAVDKIGVDNLEKMNRYGTLYAADGTEVPDPQLAYRQELINRINNEKQNIEERTGDLGILGGLFAGFRNLITGDGGNIGDAVSRSKIAAYQHALNYGDEELIRQMATGQGAYGGTASNFGEVSTSQAELTDTQNELAKDLYMTVPKALAGYAAGTAAASYSAISGTALTGAETVGLNLGFGSMTALPRALMKEAPNATLEGREFDQQSIGQDILGDTVVGPVLDMLPGSDALVQVAGNAAGVLRRTKIGGSATTLLGEAVDIGGQAVQSVAMNKLEDEAAGHFSRGGHVKYLADGGSATPYRSDANIARFGASDPRFEQYGLRGLDPNSEYYQQALAYWQQVMDFQNKYNQRAAYWNQGIVGQQMQWMQMMRGMWGQSGYFAKGGEVQYLERGGRKNPVNPHTLAPIQEKLDRDSMGSVIGDAAHNLSTLVPGAFNTASTPFIVGRGAKRQRNQERSDEFDALYKHYMLDNMRASADVFDWPGMFGVNRFANDTLLDENGVELPMSQQPDYVKQSRFDRNWENGLDTIGENVFGVKPKTKYEDQDAFTQWGMRLLGYKSPEQRQEEAANSPEGRKAKADTDAQVQRIEDARKERASGRASAKSEKIAMYQKYRDKYGEDLSDEDIQLFENTKTRTQMYATGKPGEVTSDASKANMLVPTRVTHADREKGLLTSETVLKSAGPLPESNLERRNGLTFKKDPNGPGFTDTSFKGFPEKAFVDIAPGPYEQKLIDEQKAIADAQAAADANAKMIGSSKIPGTVSGVGGMTLDDGTSGSFTNTLLSSEPYDPFAGTDSKPVTAAPSATSAAAAADLKGAGAAASGMIPGTGTVSDLKGATAAALPATKPTAGSSFTPTGNVGVDGLMNKPLDIKKGRDRGNQARYRSRLDALRRAGADNKALDEFKAQYRGKVYDAENQQLYDYNKARLSGRAAHMINPKDRTPEQQARAEAYKNDILTPNAEARKKSLATGSPMPSIASRAAEYNKRKTGGAASQAAAGASPSTSPQNVSSLGGSVGGALSGLFGGQTGAALGSVAGNVLGNLANLPNGNNLQAMTSQMNGGASQQGQPQLQPNRNAAPNIPAQVASQSRTSNLLGANQNNGSRGTSTGYGGGMGGGGPIQVNTTGTQEIIVRLPDIQALVNQSITSLIYDTIGSTFKNLADRVMTANNFEDVANSLSQGYTDATTKKVSSQGQVGGK